MLEKLKKKVKNPKDLPISDLEALIKWSFDGEKGISMSYFPFFFKCMTNIRAYYK